MKIKTIMCLGALMLLPTMHVDRALASEKQKSPQELIDMDIKSSYDNHTIKFTWYYTPKPNHPNRENLHNSNIDSDSTIFDLHKGMKLEGIPEIKNVEIKNYDVTFLDDKRFRTSPMKIIIDLEAITHPEFAHRPDDTGFKEFVAYESKDIILQTLVEVLHLDKEDFKEENLRGVTFAGIIIDTSPLKLK